MSYDILSKDKLEYTLGKIKEKIDAGGGGTTVVPNPEGEATENLEKIKIGNDIYKIEGSEGTTVIPNPEDEATDSLHKIKIGEDIYKIEGSSGANTDIIAKEWNNAETYNKNDHVIHDEKLWKSILDNNSGNTPSTDSLYWVTTDVGMSLSDKQDKLTAGDNITIEDNVVSADLSNVKVTAANTEFNDVNASLLVNNVQSAIDKLTEKTIGTVMNKEEIYNILGYSDIQAGKTLYLKGYKKLYYAGTMAGSTKTDRFEGGCIIDLEDIYKSRLMTEAEEIAMCESLKSEIGWTRYTQMDRDTLTVNDFNKITYYWYESVGSNYGTIVMTFDFDNDSVRITQSYNTNGGVLAIRSKEYLDSYMTPFKMEVTDDKHYGYVDNENDEFHKFLDSEDLDEHAVNYSLDDTGNGLTIEGGFIPKGPIYSTEEQIVGTWIDDRPIYQKTFVLTSPSATISTKILDTSSMNIDHIISFEGYIYAKINNTNTYQCVSINWYFDSNTNTSTYYDTGDNGIMQRIYGDPYKNRPEYLTLRYIKPIE